MIVFLGDYIFQLWDPEQYKMFSKFEPINFGVAGYTTGDIIHFLEATKLHGMKPDVIVILIGTNNSDRNYTTQMTFDDIKKIIQLLWYLCPESEIILLGILPRGDSHLDRQRVFNETINKMLQAECFPKNVHYTDLGFLFLKGDLTISRKIMFDGLHLTSKGYSILSETLSKLISILLGEAF